MHVNAGFCLNGQRIGPWVTSGQPARRSPCGPSCFPLAVRCFSDLVGGADDDFGDGPAAWTRDDVLDGFGDVVGVQLFDVGEASGHSFLNGRLLVADEFGLRQARLDDREADVAPGVLLPPGGEVETCRSAPGTTTVI
jgi:hypothetical protein